MSATSNNGYKMNFTTKTITITKAFEEALLANEAEAVNVITRFQNLFPDLIIVRKTHRPSNRTNPDKGLTYARMERYIGFHENAEELLSAFHSIVGLATTQKNSYLYTKEWFVKHFPNYQKMPVLKNGRLPAVKIEEADNQETIMKKVMNF